MTGPALSPICKYPPSPSMTNNDGSTSTSRSAAVEMMRRYIESLPPEVSLKEEVRSYQLWKAVRTEFLVTLFLVLMGCGASVNGGVTSSTETTANRTASSAWSESLNFSWIHELKVAFAFGFTVTTLVQCVGNISGAHLNPAVSVALLVTRHISPLRTAAYVAAQCGGAVMGAVILYGLTPSVFLESGRLGQTCVHSDVYPTQAFGVEFMITFLVVLTVLANMDPYRVDAGFKALSIGLAYTVGHLFGYRYTGASMNPARSLGPAVVMNTWSLHWVYWIGPLLGGIIAGFTYEYTQDSTRSTHYLKRSFRRPRGEMKRDQSALSSAETELTSPSNDYRI